MLVEEWKRKNPPIQRKPITNADHIRTMSDEELVEWLHIIMDCEFCPAIEKAKCWNGKYCRERLHDWLQQEVENGNTTYTRT